MRKLRGIHLFFILLFIAIIVCFWGGYLFGKETQRQEDLVQISEANLLASKVQKSIVEESEDIEKPHEESIETTTEYEVPKFYLKQDGDYVTVFVAATDEIYFETDILVEEMPIELQEELKYQIDFYDLESVYTFLENYSS